MMRVVFTVLLATLALSLSSCELILRAVLPGCEPVTVHYDSTDPDLVFRGSWSGTVTRYPDGGEDRQLVLDVSATYVDHETYDVSGTLQLGSEPPVAFDGQVEGSCAERYVRSGSSALATSEVPSGSDLEPQSSPPQAFLEAQARDDANTLVWEIYGFWSSGVTGGVWLRLVDPDADSVASSSWEGYVTRNDSP